MKQLHEGVPERLLRSDFCKGVLTGALLAILLMISWRLALFAAGIAALYFLLRKKP